MYLLSKEIKEQLPQHHPDVEEPSCPVAKPMETSLPHADPTYVQGHICARNAILAYRSRVRRV
jgi:hypothetical protein